MSKPLADLIDEQPDSDLLRIRSWSTQWRGKPTTLYMHPALYIQAGRPPKIKLLAQAELEYKQTIELAKALINLAESQQQFDQPLQPAGQRLEGRTWKISKESGQPGLAFSHLNDNKVSLLCNGEMTPRVARQLGNYLLNLGGQIAPSS